MHKIFAKPLFLGKKVVFLPECHSTNDELMSLVRSQNAEEGTLVYTDHQKGGKGQRGNIWVDEPGKNILMSVLLKPKYLAPTEQYLLNVVVGLSVIKTLSEHIGKSNLYLKWPNDVLIQNQKICGILVENVVKGSMLETAIAGVGINLNQKGFSLPSATSLFLETNKETDRESFIEDLLADLEYFLLRLKNGQHEALIQQYYDRLYLKDQVGRYKDATGEFDGIVMGIDRSGRLIVNREGKMYHYAMKEITFLA